MKRTHFEIRPGAGEQLYVTLIAPNGQTLVTSEGYKDVRDARKLVHAIKRTSENTPVLDYSPANPESPGGRI